MKTIDSPPDSESPGAGPTRSDITARQFNIRVGLILFSIYLVLYVTFVLINAFAASLMEIKVVAGLNLAIVYGFGLIIAAVVMAFVYGLICKTERDGSTGHAIETTQAITETAGDQQ